MKPITLLCATAVLTLPIFVLAAPKDDVLEATKKLGDEPSYSWKMTVSVPEGAQFRPGPSEGQTEKGGYTYLKSTFGENTMETIIKGEKGVVTNQEGGWETLDEAAQAEGPGRFRAMMARNFKAPAAQAAELAKGAKDLKNVDDTYSSDLSEEAVKSLLTFRFRPGADAPAVSGANGSVKFWLKDGALTKYQFKVKGTVTFNGNDREVDRTTTVEIKDIGSTKVKVPEEAKKKLS